MRFPFPSLLVLALPLLEIAGFIVVGRQIGVLPTLGLVLASAFAGLILLRIQGFGVMTRIRSEVDAGRDPSRQLAHGVMVLLAGILLLIPGFVTDIFGILLFLPPARDLAWRLLRGRMDVRTASGSTATFGFARSSGGPRGRTIDLDADEYSAGAKKSPPTRIERS